MPEHVALLTKLFESLDAPVRIMNVAAAELVKNAANSYLSTRLAFVNEISTLAEEYGSDVGQVIEALSDDPRIGTSFFRPALAFGGSCLPNASAALVHAGAQRGLSLALMSAAAAKSPILGSALLIFCKDAVVVMSTSQASGTAVIHA